MVKNNAMYLFRFTVTFREAQIFSWLISVYQNHPRSIHPGKAEIEHLDFQVFISLQQYIEFCGITVKLYPHRKS